MGHGMDPSDARRVRVTGNQLKTEFLNKYCLDGILKYSVNLIQPIPINKSKSVLIKSGMNWQFRLGRIEDIEKYIQTISPDGRTIKYKDHSNFLKTILTNYFLEKYAFNTTLFIARYGTKWQVYYSQDIIELLLDHCTIRILETGRIKIDFHCAETIYKGIMTIEYRPEEHKKNWVFGAHGGNAGEQLRRLLEVHLMYTELPI